MLSPRARAALMSPVLQEVPATLKMLARNAASRRISFLQRPFSSDAEGDAPTTPSASRALRSLIRTPPPSMPSSIRGRGGRGRGGGRGAAEQPLNLSLNLERVSVQRGRKTAEIRSPPMTPAEPVLSLQQQAVSPPSPPPPSPPSLTPSRSPAPTPASFLDSPFLLPTFNNDAVLKLVSDLFDQSSLPKAATGMAGETVLATVDLLMSSGRQRSGFWALSVEGRQKVLASSWSTMRTSKKGKDISAADRVPKLSVPIKEALTSAVSTILEYQTVDLVVKRAGQQGPMSAADQVMILADSLKHLLARNAALVQLLSAPTLSAQELAAARRQAGSQADYIRDILAFSPSALAARDALWAKLGDPKSATPSSLTPPSPSPPDPPTPSTPTSRVLQLEHYGVNDCGVNATLIVSAALEGRAYDQYDVQGTAGIRAERRKLLARITRASSLDLFTYLPKLRAEAVASCEPTKPLHYAVLNAWALHSGICLHMRAKYSKMEDEIGNSSAARHVFLFHTDYHYDMMMQESPGSVSVLYKGDAEIAEVLQRQEALVLEYRLMMKSKKLALRGPVDEDDVPLSRPDNIFDRDSKLVQVDLTESPASSPPRRRGETNLKPVEQPRRIDPESKLHTFAQRLAASASTQQTCRAWLAGKCRRADNKCKFAHVADPDTAAAVEQVNSANMLLPPAFRLSAAASKPPSDSRASKTPKNGNVSKAKPTESKEPKSKKKRDSKELCKFAFKGLTCPHGAACRFEHPVAAPRVTPLSGRHASQAVPHLQGYPVPASDVVRQSAPGFTQYPQGPVGFQTGWPSQQHMLPQHGFHSMQPGNPYMVAALPAAAMQSQVVNFQPQSHLHQFDMPAQYYYPSAYGAVVPRLPVGPYFLQN